MGTINGNHAPFKSSLKLCRGKGCACAHGTHEGQGRILGVLLLNSLPYFLETEILNGPGGRLAV